MTTMSADIKPKVAPLVVGELVRVVAGTYSAVKVGTVARVARVRPRRGNSQPELYELVGWPEYLFWHYELTPERAR